jgi:hypothetical protein
MIARNIRHVWRHQPIQNGKRRLPLAAAALPTEAPDRANVVWLFASALCTTTNTPHYNRRGSYFSSRQPPLTLSPSIIGSNRFPDDSVAGFVEQLMSFDQIAHVGFDLSRRECFDYW